MSADKNPRGRLAKGQTDTKIKLLQTARHCFAHQTYSDVTTRMLAPETGVNASLIRYYFLSKDGLYQQMLADVAEIEDRFELSEAKILFDGQRAALLKIKKLNSKMQ